MTHASLLYLGLSMLNSGGFESSNQEACNKVSYRKMKIQNKRLQWLLEFAMAQMSCRQNAWRSLGTKGCLRLSSGTFLWSFFLQDLAARVFSKCACLHHMSQYVLTAPRKLRFFLMLHGSSQSRMAEMLYFHGLRPVGVFQLVTWKVHSYLRWLTVKLFASRQDKILSSRTWCSSHVVQKTPMSSRYTLTLSSPHKNCSIICCTKSGAHCRPVGKHAKSCDNYT